MSESLPPNLFDGLTKRLDDLAASVADLKAATTTKEKQEAKEDISDAERALKKYAEAHGISMDEAEEAMNEVRSRNRRAEIREAIKEFTDDDWKEIFPEKTEEAPEEKPEPKAKEEKPKREEKPKEGDSAPSGDHWTDRRIFT